MYFVKGIVEFTIVTVVIKSNIHVYLSLCLSPRKVCRKVKLIFSVSFPVPGRL